MKSQIKFNIFGLCIGRVFASPITRRHVMEVNENMYYLWQMLLKRNKKRNILFPVFMLLAGILLPMNVRATISVQEDRFRTIQNNTYSSGNTNSSTETVQPVDRSNIGSTTDVANTIDPNRHNKIVTVKYKDANGSKHGVDKASRVIKTGITKVKIIDDGGKKHSSGSAPYLGHLKFTAPQSKLYSFTVYNIKSNNHTRGWVMIDSVKNGKLEMEKFATEGGRSYWLNVANVIGSQKKLVNRYLKKELVKSN